MSAPPVECLEDKDVVVMVDRWEGHRASKEHKMEEVEHSGVYSPGHQFPCSRSVMFQRLIPHLSCLLCSPFGGLCYTTDTDTLVTVCVLECGLMPHCQFAAVQSLLKNQQMHHHRLELAVLL